MTRSTDKKATESESASADGPNEFTFVLTWDKATKNFQKFRTNGDKVFEDFEKGYYVPSGHGLDKAKKLRVTVEAI